MKYIKFTLVFLLTFLLTGCVFDDPKFISFDSKPNSYYYSSIVYEKLQTNTDFEISVFDSNFSKYYSVESTEDLDILSSFFKSLSTSSYLNEIDEYEVYPYEISITFNNSLEEKFIFKIYDENIVSLFPWDGNFTADIISMENVSPYNNLYHFCTYIINKAHSRNSN